MAAGWPARARAAIRAALGTDTDIERYTPERPGRGLRYRVALPALDRHNDILCLELTLARRGEGWTLRDDGWHEDLSFDAVTHGLDGAWAGMVRGREVNAAEASAYEARIGRHLAVAAHSVGADAPRDEAEPQLQRVELRGEGATSLRAGARRMCMAAVAAYALGPARG